MAALAQSNRVLFQDTMLLALQAPAVFCRPVDGVSRGDRNISP